MPTDNNTWCVLVTVLSMKAKLMKNLTRNQTRQKYMTYIKKMIIEDPRITMMDNFAQIIDDPIDFFELLPH